MVEGDKAVLRFLDGTILKGYIEEFSEEASVIRALAEPDQRSALGAARLFGVDACPAYGRRVVDEGALTASVATPANTALALEQLSTFWAAGRPLPLRSFTEPSPYPTTSI